MTDERIIPYQGKDYARVSSVISPHCDFSGIPKEVFRNKTIIGTKIHDAIHDDIQGDFPVVPTNGIGYFKSYEKWRARLAPIFLESEVRYYDDTKLITGCVDAVVKFQGEKEAVLVDFKTSAQESPITWPMQAHLYHYLITNSGKLISPRFLFVKLDKDGDLPRVFEYTFDRNTLAKCMKAIDEFWIKFKASIDKVG